MSCRPVLLLVALAVGACSDQEHAATAPTTAIGAPSSMLTAVTAQQAAPATAPATVTTGASAVGTTTGPTGAPPTLPPPTAPASSAPETAPATTPPPASVAPTEPSPTPYVVPVADVAAAGWGTTHATYPATDIFVDCGAAVVSPVNGELLEVRRVNAYDPAVDNPATRGGRSISILGDDGVRYYLAHFDTILETLEPGVRVLVGQPLGTMGDTGRASACHTHFGISPPCPGKEWAVRRGVVWPYVYLDAWREGQPTSPADEVADWLAANPTACSEAIADPNAADS